MKLLVDMSLPPAWAEFFQNAGWEAVHCSKLEVPLLKDSAVASWARENSYVLVTHDLDFGAALSLGGKDGPSIFQVTASDLMPLQIGPAIARSLRELEALLEKGAIMLIDLESGKGKVFPITSENSAQDK